MLSIRDENPADHAAVEEVNRAAFGGEAEALLVSRLRTGGTLITSLVAEKDARIVGHIMFSEVTIDAETGETVPAVSLAPLAVAPDDQRQGIGSELVRCGLEACRERGKRIVLVLGDPHFYRRFGFSVELARWLQSSYSGDHWMALELVPGALDGLRGGVRFSEAFDVVS